MDFFKIQIYNAEITVIEHKVTSTTGIATTAAINAVENKVPNFSDLVKKQIMMQKISDIETKYFATSDYNKFTGEIVNTGTSIV